MIEVDEMALPMAAYGPHPEVSGGSVCPGPTQPGERLRRPENRQRPAVIRRKITAPPLPETVVPRSRVETRAANLIEHNRIVCVYATAGSGKTTAVRQAVQHLDRPLAWLSVDATDTAPGRLLTYLEAALTRVVPAVRGVVEAALAARLPHTETAGLLADALGDEQLVVVFDDLERLASASDALATLNAFACYFPSSARLVLISRKELDLEATSQSFEPWIVEVDERTLAFTAEEAADALARIGRNDVDVSTALKATGGWITGVLFEAWRSTEYTTGLDGEADPLYGYLAGQILNQVTSQQRDFLVFTAVLDEVTASAAAALGVADAAMTFHSLGSVHLPATWHQRRSAMRCHPRFREYLLECLGRQDPGSVRRIYAAHAQLLCAQGQHEEAVEEFLKAGALDDAARVAEQVVDRVIERADFAVAQRWIDQVQPVRRDQHTALAGAELMLGLAHEDYRAGVRVADRLAATGHRDPLARSSSKLAAMMAWCYFHVGRLDDVRAVLAVGCPGADLDAMRYCMTLVDSGPPADRVRLSLSGGPLDALIMRVHYYRGQLPLLLEEPALQWAARAAESWRIGGLLAMGKTDQASHLYNAICALRDPGVWAYSLFNVELLREQNQRDEVWRALLKGRERIRVSGSEMLEALSYIEEAKLELLLNRDPSAARAVLDKLRSHPVGQAYGFVAEQAGTWLGLALLLEGQDEPAADTLRCAVAEMETSQRALTMATAATYLAEAEWRLGNEEAADHAMDLALSAAMTNGSNHMLLDALAEFPSTLSRRLDAEPSADSPWHDIGRALIARGVQLAARVDAHIHLREFGKVAIAVNNVERAPKIKKSYELLAFLVHSESGEASKDAVLAALFSGRHDTSTASYLRQAIQRLREALPDGAEIEAEGPLVRLTGPAAVTAESQQLLRLVAEAADLHGEHRYAVLMQALKIGERGEYLPGISSEWAEERRNRLGTTLLDIRSELAQLAFAGGSYKKARSMVGAVLKADPYRESMWRLSMRLAAAMGDADGVLAAYRQCAEALCQLDARPSATTRRLVNDLRP